MKLRCLAWLWAALVSCAYSLQADVITEWNTLLLDAIRNESTSPPLAARNLAIVHTAIYDAVNALEQSHELYFAAASAPLGASEPAAAVGAAYECLASLYPSQLASFDAALTRFTANTAEGQSREDGLSFGRNIAFVILSWRGGDNSSTTVPYIPSAVPGQWRRTPPFFRPPELPQWPYVTPFTMTNRSQFRPLGPPPLGSTLYTRDFNLVKDWGGIASTNRTDEQTLVARFWSDFSYTVTPPGHWNQIAQNVATNHASTLAQNARLFALLNVAMADAAIVAWDAKYLFNSWRPVTAIQLADLDGNPDTASDPNWLPLLNTPAFPEYCSGHSTFSAAAATILASFYGTDKISFVVVSDALPGVVRAYDSFAAAAEEIGMSRIYGGIHFLSADLDGLEAGRRLGDYVFKNFLRPLPVSARLGLARPEGAASARVSVAGALGVDYVLETSPDMLRWTAVMTNLSPFVFEDAAGPALPARFYRASVNE